MVRINEKLGLRPAGKRGMMQLPKDRAEAAALTALTCPACGRHGIRVVPGAAQRRLCSFCGHVWLLT